MTAARTKTPSGGTGGLLLELGDSGIADVSPLFSEVGAEVFAGDGAGGGAFDVGAAFGRDLAHPVFPLGNNRRSNPYGSR